MDSNTIGVISTPDGRSSRDLQMMQNFSCTRPNQRGSQVNGSGTVVLGSTMEERSSRDKQMLAQFSCSRENYVGPDGMIYPRSSKDEAMLKEFNACPCKEPYTKTCSCTNCGCGCMSGRPCKCRGNCSAFSENYCGPPANNPFSQLNFNPYNSSSSITYVPVGKQ
jgi:hypothetical protein